MEETFNDIKKFELKLDISGFFMAVVRVILSILIIVFLISMTQFSIAQLKQEP